LFNVGDGVILVEKYCDVCAKHVKWAKQPCCPYATVMKTP
jgi:hypothetical protein